MSTLASVTMPIETHTLKALFLPYLTTSHLVPLVDIALLFAARGVEVTIVTTHYNALLFQNSVDHAISSGHRIDVQILKFPSEEVGLPSGIENFSHATSRETANKLFRALLMLQRPMEEHIRDRRPDCLIADMHYFWASDLAAELGIPRLIFHARGFFALCAVDSIFRYAPHEEVQSDVETFVVPNLPDEIRLSRPELPEWVRVPNGYTVLMNKIRESDLKSHGAVVNSFYELEEKYVDHYRNVHGRKAWSIGPASLRSNSTPTNADHSCLEWLNSKKPNSVLYVSFGSLSCFSSIQLVEIAIALESSRQTFIWVIRKEGSDESEWLPEGFELRITESGKGMLIRGWAPQIMILEHPATGGFVTHCGWNSVLESAAAGVAMVTWPLSAEHFYNEKLVTQVLKVGVEVGPHSWSQLIEESKSFLNREQIGRAVSELMGSGEEAVRRRRRAEELAEAAKNAVEVGGSSYNNLTDLVDGLQRIREERQMS